MVSKFIKLYMLIVMIWFFMSFFIVGSKAAQNKMNQEVMVLRVNSLKFMDTGFDLKKFTSGGKTPIDDIFSDMEMKLRIGFR